MGSDRCLSLSDHEARAALAGATRLVKPFSLQPTPPTCLAVVESVVMPGPGYAVIRWRTETRYGPCIDVTRHQAPCVPGDVAVLREKFSYLERDGTNEVTGRLLGLPNVWYWADGDPRGGDWTRPLSPSVMPAALARHRRKVTSVEAMFVPKISEETWRLAGFVGAWPKVVWTYRYKHDHPWETAWAWVIGWEG